MFVDFEVSKKPFFKVNNNNNNNKYHLEVGQFWENSVSFQDKYYIF